MDFRRSGAVKAQAGDVDPLALATKMAISINQSKSLQETYLPKRATTGDEQERSVRKSCNSLHVRFVPLADIATACRKLTWA
jgi:hypothetical protein